MKKKDGYILLNVLTPNLSKMYCPLLLLFVLIACSTTKPIVIDSQLTRQAGYEQIKDGLKIYIRPLEDKKEIERYFGADLLERDILPVFVLAENQNKNRVFLVEPSDKDYKVPHQKQDNKHDVNRHMSVKESKESVYETDREKFLVTTGVLGGPIIFLAILPLAIMSDFEYGPTDAAKSLQQAMISQSLRKQTLTPGRSEQGFLYYKLPSERYAAQMIGVSIKATDVETQEIMYFIYKKELGSEGK